MGTFAFAKSFRMLEEKRWHSVVVQLRGAMTVLGTLSSIPWLARIGFTFFPRTWVIGDWHTMTRWCKDRMTERINAGNSIPVEQVVVLTPDNQSQDEKSDIASWLIDASQKNNSIEVDRHWLNGDAIAIVIAGRYAGNTADALCIVSYSHV